MYFEAQGMNTIKRISLILATLALAAGLAMSAYAQEDEYVVSQAELDQILAPIALYPDTVLSHILIAATYPLEVIEAHRWAQKNPGVSGNQALDAVENKTWDPSVKALSAFPQILKKMSADLQWMQTLGDVFLQDEESVLFSVQELRKRANDNGTLKDLDHMRVVEDDNNIVIESRVKEIVYVPYYDTRVVYGPWWWNNYPPVYWSGIHTGLTFYWGPRVRVGTSIYFSSFHWNRRHVVVVDRHLHSRYRFYSGRHVASHSSSKRWAHNPSHRRGVHYRSPVVKKRYANLRSAHRVTDKRNNLRNERVNTHRTEKRTSKSVSERLRQQRTSSIHQRATEKRKERTSKTKDLRQTRYSTEKRHITTAKATAEKRSFGETKRSQNNKIKATRPNQPKKQTNTSRYRSKQDNDNVSRASSSRERKTQQKTERANNTSKTNVRSSNSFRQLKQQSTRQQNARVERNTRLTSSSRTPRRTEKSRSNYSEKRESRIR